MAKKHISAHDKFVRVMMTDPKVIREFFEENLPADIKEIVNLNTIAPQPESFIDDHLRLQITDLLYSVDFQGEQGFLYLLCEHSTSQSPLLPFRMLKYSISVMDHYLKGNKAKKLPLVYPLIFYTGSRRYTHSTDLFKLFAPHEERAKAIFTTPYQLIDLSQVNDDNLKAHLWYGVMARLMKHIYEKNIVPALKDLMAELQKIEQTENNSYIYRILSYAIEAGKVPDKEEFIQAVTHGLRSVDEDKIMTIAELLKQDVFKRGIEKGEFKKAREIARSMLQKGIDSNIIMEVTGLSLAQIKELIH